MNPRLVTPLVSAGAAWVTRKTLNAAYAARHDGQVPTRDDTQVPFRRVLIWTLTTALVVALVDVAVQQSIARLAENQSHSEIETT